MSNYQRMRRRRRGGVRESIINVNESMLEEVIRFILFEGGRGRAPSFCMGAAVVDLIGLL